MFVQYVVDKYEQRLLAAVDRRMTEELVGRFRVELAPQDPLMVAVRRMVGCHSAQHGAAGCAAGRALAKEHGIGGVPLAGNHTQGGTAARHVPANGACR